MVLFSIVFSLIPWIVLSAWQIECRRCLNWNGGWFAWEQLRFDFLFICVFLLLLFIHFSYSIESPTKNQMSLVIVQPHWMCIIHSANHLNVQLWEISTTISLLNRKNLNIRKMLNIIEMTNNTEISLYQFSIIEFKNRGIEKNVHQT